MMRTPFRNDPFSNDPFSLVYQAFENLFPGKSCLCFWEPEIRPSADGEKVYGLTNFGDDGIITVFIDSNLTVEDAICCIVTDNQ